MLSLRILVLLLIALLPPLKPNDQDSSVDKNGSITVLVTWGDNDNTPANDVFIEAHGYVQKDHSMKSFEFHMVRAGHYEISLPPAVYDVFVSESGSEPRCKRLLVSPGMSTYWNLKLEIDHIYSQK